MTTPKKNEMKLVFFAIIYAVILLLVLVNETAHCFEVLGGDAWFYVFYSFTNQSNLLVAVWLACFGITRFVGQESKFSRFINSRILITALTVYITMTFLIVAFVLAPIYKGHFIHGISGTMFFTHLLTPIVMWIYFFLVSGNGNPKYRHAWYVLAYPIGYMLLNLVFGALFNIGGYSNWVLDNFGNWTYTTVVGEKMYIYEFLNPFWYPNVFLFVLAMIVITAFFGLLGMGLIKFKRYLAKSFYDEMR